MALTLLLARHGQTDLNVDDRWQGRLDVPLNDAGLAQAAALERALPAQVDHVLASPLLRARQTAHAVAAPRGLVVRLDDDFRERDFGVFEGLTPQEAQWRYPELSAANAAYRWDMAPPEAEGTREVIERVGRGLERLRRDYAGGTVLLVSHGFVVRCLRYLIDQVPDEDFFTAPRIPNGTFLTRHWP